MTNTIKIEAIPKGKTSLELGSVSTHGVTYDKDGNNVGEKKTTDSYEGGAVVSSWTEERIRDWSGGKLILETWIRTGDVPAADLNRLVKRAYSY